MLQLIRTIFHFPSLIKYLNVWRVTSITASWMVTRGITRSLLLLRTKKRLRSHPFGTFTYHRMPFGLCNAPATFQRCMLGLFFDMVERFLEIFMDDFSIYGDSFSQCLHHLELVLQRCAEKNLTLNWEKCHFMVKHLSLIHI